MKSVRTEGVPKSVVCARSLEEEYFRAGERVPAGDYLQVESTREVHFDSEDALPASLDGHVAVYVRRPIRWAQILKRQVEVLAPHKQPFRPVYYLGGSNAQGQVMPAARVPAKPVQE